MIESFSGLFSTATLIISLIIRMLVLCVSLDIAFLAISFLKKATQYFDKRIEYLEMRINVEKNNTENTDKE